MTLRFKFIKFINRLLFKLAVWLDERLHHPDVTFCLLIDEFYVKCGLWK